MKRTNTLKTNKKHRDTIEGLPKVSNSKMELAHKLSEQTTGTMRSKTKKQKTNMNDTSFDQMLRD